VDTKIVQLQLAVDTLQQTVDAMNTQLSVMDGKLDQILLIVSP
jgi:hypothetical protein